jgi:glutamate formiminotransferase
MIDYTNKEALRIICKWVNEDIVGDINKQALVTILNHYIELAGHYDDE